MPGSHNRSRPKTGTRVKLDGLVAKPELNGCSGIIKSKYNPKTGRCGVKLDDESNGKIIVQAKLANIVIFTQQQNGGTTGSSYSIDDLRQKYPPDSNKLELIANIDDSQFIDFDSVLAYAISHMKRVKHFSIAISQEYLLPDTMNQYEYRGINLNMTLTPKLLSSFLESQIDNLMTFEFSVGDCCEKYTKIITDGGKAFLPLSCMPKLEKIHFSCAVFDNVDVLKTILLNKDSNLKNLGLSYCLIGSVIYQGWRKNDTTVIAAAIGTLSNLVNLRIMDTSFESNELRLILPNLPHLRCLTITGRFGASQHPNDRNVLPLTDNDFCYIAETCPKLQLLDVSYHRSSTDKGIEAILRDCPDLIELRCAYSSISKDSMISLLQQHEKLLLFSFGNYTGGMSLDEKRSIIMATDGRTLIMTEMEGLWENIPGLPSAVLKEMARSKKTLEDAEEWSEKDPCRHNEFEVLLTM